MLQLCAGLFGTWLMVSLCFLLSWKVGQVAGKGFRQNPPPKQHTWGLCEDCEGGRESGHCGRCGGPSRHPFNLWEKRGARLKGARKCLGASLPVYQIPCSGERRGKRRGGLGCLIKQRKMVVSR